jgi:hypothetical protein
MSIHMVQSSWVQPSSCIQLADSKPLKAVMAGVQFSSWPDARTWGNKRPCTVLGASSISIQPVNKTVY